MVIFHSHVSLLEGILKIFQRSRSTSILGLNDRVGTVEPPITSLMRMETSRRCTKKGFGPMVPQSLDALFHGESKNKMDDLGIPWGTPIFLETSKYAQIILGPKYKTKQSKHEIKRACRPRTSPKHRPIRQPKTSKTPLVLIPATAPTAGRLFLAQAPVPIGVGQTAKFRRESHRDLSSRCISERPALPWHGIPAGDAPGNIGWPSHGPSWIKKVVSAFWLEQKSLKVSNMVVAIKNECVAFGKLIVCYRKSPFSMGQSWSNIELNDPFSIAMLVYWWVCDMCWIRWICHHRATGHLPCPDTAWYRWESRASGVAF